jgi:hypothetical protein
MAPGLAFVFPKEGQEGFQLSKEAKTESFM